MRTGYHGALGLVFSEDLPYAFADPTAIQFLQGVAQACRERRANLLLIATRAEGESADAALGASPQAVRDAAVDGFLLYSLARDSPVIAPVCGRGLPLVVVDQPRLSGTPYIGVDDFGALGRRRSIFWRSGIAASPSCR